MMRALLDRIPGPGLRAVRIGNDAVPEPARRLRIQFLGHFRILRDGTPLDHGRKTPRKPLALLKVLAAEGGCRVDTATIAGRLWPELDGDAACAAFDITLHRLRRLLGVREALRRVDRKLSLDPRLCCTDIWQFDAIVESIANSNEAAACPAQAAMLLRAYPGDFLEQESQEGWAIACRDRLREKFHRAVQELGGRLERTGQWRQAAALYSRVLELDNLAEPLYRRLMACYRELGETAEAIRAYRRCRELLGIVLGVTPSAETESLRLLLGAPPVPLHCRLAAPGMED